MGAYSRGVLICYFGREGGRLFGGGRLFEEYGMPKIVLE